MHILLSEKPILFHHGHPCEKLQYVKVGLNLILEINRKYKI